MIRARRQANKNPLLRQLSAGRDIKIEGGAEDGRTGPLQPHVVR